jgi:deazaflavin-dependent oxidoreductase (nitroreductase family)
MDQRAFNADVIAKFREGREIEGMHRNRLLLLTTLGRATGEPRTAPMMFSMEGDFNADPVVIASNNGAARHPSWFLNLESEPRVTVELPDETYETTAQVLDGAEYERVWASVTAATPFFVEHQERAGARRIPLIRLPRDERG